MKKKVGIVLPLDVFKEIKIRCATRGITLETGYLEALTQWLGAIPAPGYQGPHHERLAEILTSGDEALIHAITLNLEAFIRALRAGFKGDPPSQKPRRKAG